ncbi:rab9 effector protein with kelch motifs-like isoform X2 [Selaginella moellendorffii]|nr:rab9 effector protein with kelch motifs-like isoform X2 [Selaginella moellendorffii]XP_024526580.1 rab9 effector protein with kelch motifs-like isoform X2 [Selaginella moellendorffii]|eukprot:XP_024526573.1 rab9 effector protein with kelch motifs-like isoform X2 [Selaginella moellendorffii]
MEATTTRSEASWFHPKLADQNLPERWGHSGVYCDGKLYIYGGCRGGLQFSDVLMLDLETMSWENLVTTGEEPGPRDSHTAVLYDHQKMIVFGGTSGSKKTNAVHVLDLKSLVWARPSMQGSLPAPRESHTATMISENQALVFGGSGDNGDYLSDTHILDCGSMKWISLCGKGYSPICRDSHSSVVIKNRLFLYGGDCGDRYLGDVDVLDLELMTWSKLENAGSTTKPGVRAGHVAIAVDTKMYVFGGVGDRTYYSDVWAMDVETRCWSQLKIRSLQPQGRFSHVAARADDGVIVYGGCGEDERPLDEFLVLCIGGEELPKPGIWSKLNNEQRMQIVGQKTSSRPSVSSRKDDLATRRVLCSENLLMKGVLQGYAAERTFQMHKKRTSRDLLVFRENDDWSVVESTVSGKWQAPNHGCSHNRHKSLTLKLGTNHDAQWYGIQIGSEVHGVVDAMFDSGYLMTTHLNGQVLRGVLFSRDRANTTEKEDVSTRVESPGNLAWRSAGVAAPRSIAVEEKPSAMCDDEEEVTLSLATNHVYAD